MAGWLFHKSKYFHSSYLFNHCQVDVSDLIIHWTHFYAEY